MNKKLIGALIVMGFTVNSQASFCGSDHNWNTSCKATNSSKVTTNIVDTKISAVKTVKNTASKAKSMTMVTKKKVGIINGVFEVAGISRNQDKKNLVDPAFAKTSRSCPPFCIQPTYPFAPARVETISELDMIHAARDVANGDTSKVLIDARTPGWVKKGTIPHSINVPFTRVNSKALAKDPMDVVEVLTTTFGVVDMDGVLNYDKAKTLYLFCNGSWCGQSPASIKALLTMGYPQDKIKYYRGGMNDWKLLGLTTK